MKKYLATLYVVLVLTTRVACGGVYLTYNSTYGGTDLLGWTWRYDPGSQGDGYSDLLGWAEDNGSMKSGAWYNRLVQISGYYPNRSTAPLAAISTSIVTPTGDKTLHVYEQSGYPGSTGGPGWYFINGANLGAQGITDATTNRMDFYVRPNGLSSWDTSYPYAGVMHFGTYTCWDDGAGGSTKPCPYETDAPVPPEWASHVSTYGGTVQAGSHYYHYMYINSVGQPWVHVLLDQHPNHARQASGSGEPTDDPSYTLFEKHYFQNMGSFYLETRYQEQQSPLEYYVGPFNFWTQTNPENDLSISSVWVAYYESSQKWEIGFSDNSFNDTGYNEGSKSKFEIRWSTSQITNDSWDSSTPVVPEYFRFGFTNAFRRWDPWSKNAWTRFSLPAESCAAGSKIYFAIKDVSAVSDGDGHDAPSALVKTIDYSMPQQLTGACGSSNGLALSSAPTVGLCTAGTASAVTGTGPWSWTCAGSGGGSTASCGASVLNNPSSVVSLRLGDRGSITVGPDGSLKTN